MRAIIVMALKPKASACSSMLRVSLLACIAQVLFVAYCRAIISNGVRIEIFASPYIIDDTKLYNDVLRVVKDKEAFHSAVNVYVIVNNKVLEAYFYGNHGRAAYESMSAVFYIEGDFADFRTSDKPPRNCDSTKISGKTSMYFNHVCNSDTYAVVNHVVNFNSPATEDATRVICSKMYYNPFNITKHVPNIADKLKKLTWEDSYMFKTDAETAMYVDILHLIPSNPIQGSVELAKNSLGLKYGVNIFKAVGVANKIEDNGAVSDWVSRIPASSITLGQDARGVSTVFDGRVCVHRDPKCRSVIPQDQNRDLVTEEDIKFHFDKCHTDKPSPEGPTTVLYKYRYLTNGWKVAPTEPGKQLDCSQQLPRSFKEVERQEFAKKTPNAPPNTAQPATTASTATPSNPPGQNTAAVTATPTPAAGAKVGGILQPTVARPPKPNGAAPPAASGKTR